MDARFKFKFNIYQRRFKQPLRTNHGVWQIREGIIISLTDKAGKITTYGEIAPLPWFGSETMTEALELCHSLKSTISISDIAAISDRFPCCQFALESAWLNQTEAGGDKQSRDLEYCYLLPAGEKALTTWKNIYHTHSATTFKWKIGVYPLDREIEILKQLVAILPAHIKLRLDANGGLNLTQARKLLAVTDTLQAIEFIEQPLPPNDLDKLINLSQKHSTSLALDESVASYQKLINVYQQGWQGVFVIKAAIMGFPSKLKEFCQINSLDIVLSSVFETEIGFKVALKLAQELNHPRAVGFGVKNLLDEN